MLTVSVTSQDIYLFIPEAVWDFLCGFCNNIFVNVGDIKPPMQL
jgi:hypothetical protein